MLFIDLQIIWGVTLHPSRQDHLPRASLAWPTTNFLQRVIASNKKVKTIVDGRIYLDFHAGPALPYPPAFRLNKRSSVERWTFIIYVCT